jgi:hypothetical protein
MALSADLANVQLMGTRNSVPAAAAATIYEGSMVGLASGYGRALVAGDVFVGHCLAQVDNSAGAAAAKNITVLAGRYRLRVAISGVAVTSVGRPVYASDDATVTLTPNGSSPVGMVTRYDASGYGEVEFDAMPWHPLGISARSRAAVELPSLAILANFNLHRLMTQPFSGSFLWTDFTHAPCLPDPRFIDATYAAAAGGKTPTEHMYLGVTAIGELKLFGTTDNQAVEGQWACPIVVSGGRPWAFGVRIKQSLLTDAKAGWFAGLMLGQKLTGDLIVDAGTLQTEGSLGFQCKEGDGDKIDLVYDETGQTQNEHDDDYVTQVADTYNVLELYCNGTTIQGYLDGVLTGTAIVALDIAAADFPAGKVFVPTLALKNAHADDFTVTADWIYAMQEAV